MKTISNLTIVLILVVISDQILGQIQFKEHIIDPEEKRISGVQSCDIDCDGDNDIVASSTNSGKIIYYRNDGGSPVKFTKLYVDKLFQKALYLYCADINNDSLPDIAVSSGMSGVIAWWKNNGDTPLTWTKQVITTGFENSHGVNIIDVDNDGNMDVVASAAGAHTIAWWRNDGNENISWTRQDITNDFNTTQTVYTIDIDNDGDADVLGGSSGDNEIALWINDGSNPINWTKQSIGENFGLAHWVYADDVDGDGLTDVLGAAYTSSQIAWWKNNGGNPISWTKHVVGTSFLGAVTVHADDIDNDGDVDILGTAWRGDDIAVWLNNGDSPVTWEKVTIDYSNNGIWPIFTSDIDNDGDIDIITGADVLTGPGTSASITWWENVTTTDVKQDNESSPTGFELKQNYPNPFNPSTHITYSIEKDNNVTLKIFDVLGEEINTLVDKYQFAGTEIVSWNGENKFGEKVNSGVYIVRLRSEEYSSYKKMILAK